MKTLALSLASQGYVILALYPIVDGRCACGMPPEKCRGPGKHPRFAAGQHTEGRWSCTSDPEVIERIWAVEPRAGIGIATEESGLLILDFDSDDALNWIAVQEGRHGEIITRTVDTPRGMHLYLRAPAEPIKTTVGVLHKGVDTRAWGGYVVAPGSAHRSGNPYTLCSDAPVAECPPWLLDMLRSSGCMRVKRTVVRVGVEAVDAPSPGALTEAKGIAEHYVARLEGRQFPGPIYGLLNEAAFRLGQFIASGCLDIDYVRGRLVAGLRVCDARDVYLEKNLAIIDAAMVDAEDQPDVPRAPLGVSLTRDDLAALARPASVPGIVKRALREGAKGDVPCEPEQAEECLSRLASFLAEKKPDTEPASIDTLFAASISLLDRHCRQRGLPGVAPDALSRRFAAHLAKAAAVASEEPWREKVATTKEGTPKDTTGNLLLILREHRPLADLVGYNERTDRTTFLRDAPWGARAGAEVGDADHGELAAWMTEHLRLSPRTAHCSEAIQAAARGAAHDPVCTYLDGLSWDGVPRIDTWLTRYAGAEDTEYVRAIGAKWLISGVARARRPGCKADYTLVLEGAQGARKSTLLSTLAGGWFSDELHDLGNKGAAEILQGPWIVEISEVDRILASRDASELKAFLTRPVDRYRAAFARCAEDRPRRCIFAASTNDGQYLVDATGDRRYWPIKVSRCDVGGVREDRDQLWAEAAARYAAGEAWYLSDDLETKAGEAQADRSVIDPWEEGLTEGLESRSEPITMTAVLTLCGVPVAQQTQHSSRRAGRLLRRLGWERRTLRTGTTQRKLWVKSAQ